MVAKGFTVDLDKPLVHQVGYLGVEYQDWVHQPIVTKEGPRFFQSDFWEFLTRYGGLSQSFGFQSYAGSSSSHIKWAIQFLRGNTIHYLLHGCHHKHPMDGLRLVFPPAATAVLCFPFWNLLSLLSTPTTTPALFGGGLLGYVMYDITPLLPAPWSTIQKCGLQSQEISLEPSLQDSEPGLWDYIFSVGQGFRNSPPNKSSREK